MEIKLLADEKGGNFSPYCLLDGIYRRDGTAARATDLGGAAAVHTHAAEEVISGVLPPARGGTGAADAAGARGTLGITPENIGAATATQGAKADAALLRSGGTMTGALVAANPAIEISAVRNSYAGTTDMTAGTTALAIGTVYYRYE